MAKKELRVTRMVMAMTVSFMGVWTPYAVCAIFVLAGKSDLLDSPAAVIPLICAKMSTFTNPFLYIMLNPQVSIARVKNSFECLFPDSFMIGVGMMLHMLECTTNCELEFKGRVLNVADFIFTRINL